MNNNYYKYSCLSLISLLIYVNSAIAIRAEDTSHYQRLNLSNNNANHSIYLSKNNGNPNNKLREYTFKAPDNKTLSNTRNLAAAQGYKVQVYGSGQELLLQVRDIEPRAFAQGNIIQVGIFSQQNNAEDMVQKLAMAGFWARIVNQ